jgi:zinc protease
MQRVFFVFAFLLVGLGGAFAQLPPGLSTKTLGNGLEVFVFRNANVPLATVQITFRAGAVGQSPETAGLFHLYEHMLFKGNDAFANEAAFNAAMTELGVSGWNGGTSNEYVNYYVTVPSDKTEKGIEFWAHAVQNPKLDPQDLEVEKNIVLNEVKGYWADPGEIVDQAVTKKLFASYPWRRDVSGSEKVLQNATVAQLRTMQQTYYVPNNASLQVSGDVDPAQVFAWAEASFGKWKRGADPWKTPPPAHPFPKTGAKLWFKHESQYPGFGLVDLRLRGPDVLADDASTYAADVWLGLLEKPDGRFKKAIHDKVPSLYQEDYLNAMYLTQRDGGYIDVSAYLLADAPGGTLTEKSEAFEKAVRDEMTAMANDPKYFSDDDFNAVKKRLLDAKVFERETASGFTSSLSFWWASANTKYYLGYDANFAKVGRADLKRFLDLYWSKPGVVSLTVNPQDAAAAPGWEEVTKDNAFWWKGNN